MRFSPPSVGTVDNPQGWWEVAKGLNAASDPNALQQSGVSTCESSDRVVERVGIVTELSEQRVSAIPRPSFTNPRTTSIEVHRHLRDLILDSTLPPGTSLKQAELARRFGISRGPVREAFRMLQEEGLIEADLNQAGRVRNVDANELDQLYGGRIALEALAVRTTTGRLTEDEYIRATTLLTEMERVHDLGDMAAWGELHRQFHLACMARVSDPLMKTITSYSERSERYLRLYQIWHPQSFATAHDEHEKILNAVRGTDAKRAGAMMAGHLARTALTVLDDLSPGSAHRAVSEALVMAGGKASIPRR